MSNLQQSTVNLLLRLQEPKLSQVEKARLLQDAMDMAAMGRQAKPKAATNNLPTSAAALRIAALFHRRPTTPWQDKEIASFRKLCPVDMEDLEMVCEYTEAERRKGDGIYRRDLFTFLNNYLGEVDRARQYAEVQPKLTPGLKAGVKMVS